MKNQKKTDHKSIFKALLKKSQQSKNEAKKAAIALKKFLRNWS